MGGDRLMAIYYPGRPLPDGTKAWSRLMPVYKDDIIKLYTIWVGLWPDGTRYKTSIGLWPTAGKFYYKIRVNLK